MCDRDTNAKSSPWSGEHRDLVRLRETHTLLLEVKGRETEKDKQKHQAAKRWVSAVNTWGEMGTWDFLVCKNPQMLEQAVRERAHALGAV